MMYVCGRVCVCVRACVSTTSPPRAFKEQLDQSRGTLEGLLSISIKSPLCYATTTATVASKQPGGGGFGCISELSDEFVKRILSLVLSSLLHFHTLICFAEFHLSLDQQS